MHTTVRGFGTFNDILFWLFQVKSCLRKSIIWYRTPVQARTLRITFFTHLFAFQVALLLLNFLLFSSDIVNRSFLKIHEKEVVQERQYAESLPDFELRRTTSGSSLRSDSILARPTYLNQNSASSPSTHTTPTTPVTKITSETTNKNNSQTTIKVNQNTVKATPIGTTSTTATNESVNSVSKLDESLDKWVNEKFSFKIKCRDMVMLVGYFTDISLLGVQRACYLSVCLSVCGNVSCCIRPISFQKNWNNCNYCCLGTISS